MKYFELILSTLLFFYTHSACAELTLKDLSFTEEEIKVDPITTQMMEVRHSKLQTHQKLGLATMIAMTTTFLLADNANKNDAHKIAGITSGLLYWTTAYFSLSAPKPEAIKNSGSSEIHRSLAWIHAPLMAIVPVLGYLHKENDLKGKESTGIIKAHGALATAAYFSFMAAGLTMYFDF